MKKLTIGIVILIILAVFFECRRRDQIRQEKLNLLDDMARRLDRIDSLRAKLNER